MDDRTKELIATYTKMAEEQGVPDSLSNGLALYIVLGLIPGGFLCAVIENNLRDAVGRADVWSQQRLPQIVGFMNMYAPAPCWGSKKTLLAWSEARAKVPFTTLVEEGEKELRRDRT